MSLGADGIKSVLRPEIIGDEELSTARPSGLSAFRFTLESTHLRESLGFQPEMIDAGQPITLTMVIALDGTQRTCVIYPCRNLELLNFVCIAKDTELKGAATESWTAAGDRDELVSLFADFPGWVAELLKYVFSYIMTGLG